MTDAQACDRIHDQASVPGKRPPQPMRRAYDVGQVAGPPRWADLHSAASPFTKAANLVEDGDEMSCRIPPDRIEVRNPTSDVGHSEPVIGRPGASREPGARIDLPTLDRQTVPVGVEGKRCRGNRAPLGGTDQSGDCGMFAVSSDDQCR